MEKKIKERFESMEALYNEVLADNIKLEECLANLGDIQKRYLELSKYYREQWLEDRDQLETSLEHFVIAGEDMIYDAIIEQYELFKKLSLSAAKYINDQEI